MAKTLHVRFEGRSYDLDLEQLRLPAGASDADVRQAVAGYLDIGLHRLDAYVVERHRNGNLTLRPEAVFG
ncbi:MAG: hypothetical protein KC503_31890 [Myxococcales bacterium]|nr:hypothetical protein [Myxococcales bacterium]